jgi:hypothetical protein
MIESTSAIVPITKPLLAAAENYLQLRDESWRIRSKALKMGSLSMAETSRCVGGHVTKRTQED